MSDEFRKVFQDEFHSRVVRVTIETRDGGIPFDDNEDDFVDLMDKVQDLPLSTEALEEHGKCGGDTVGTRLIKEVLEGLLSDGVPCIRLVDVLNIASELSRDRRFYAKMGENKIEGFWKGAL